MSNPASSKSHLKKVGINRDRDKNKIVASESGGSSQCDTPPLTDKDGNSSHGKFAGVGADSIQCMAEQIGVDINPDAASNLAEDVSYKLRQLMSTMALHSEMMKKTRLDTWDVNTVLQLSDSSPIVGATPPQYTIFGDEKLYCSVETIQNVTEAALTPQTNVFETLPTVAVEWITDEKSLNNNSNISVNLQNYYTKVARAILNLKKKPKEIAVEDLTTNTRIGPIFPNLFNLAVLVLNDDNLNALNVPAKKPLQSNVLDMVDALCSNPCSLDTNIQQQFQRLFPVMVSNILGNGSLAEKMVSILTKITRTWPSFITIGKGILFDYLSQGSKERLTAPMIKCVMALGRQALVECLGDHLDHIDDCLQLPRRNNVQTELRETLLDASSCLLRSEPTTYLEDFVLTDYTLYEMLGDSIMPRRTLFPYTEPDPKQKTDTEKSAEDEFCYTPLRPTRRPKFRIATKNRINDTIHRDTVFEPTKFSIDRINKGIHIRVKNCKNKELPHKIQRLAVYRNHNMYLSSRSQVVIATGLLDRFRYKMWQSNDHFPIFGALTL